MECRYSRLKMKNKRYSLSFTTGTLFHRESVKLAVLYFELHDWNAIRKKIISENLLQARTINSSKRIFQEVCSRLKTLDKNELELFVHGTTREQDYILWLSVCRRYKFIADFAVEVVRERYIGLKSYLCYEDFDSFLNIKSELHPEIDTIKLATRKKLRQVLFKMLREAELLTADNHINPVILSPRLLHAIPRERRSDILVFPVLESDIMGRHHDSWNG